VYGTLFISGAKKIKEIARELRLARNTVRSIVRRYGRAWERRQSARQAEAYVPLAFAPGEAYQFDWSHECVVIDGVTTMAKVAHVRLRHSRMLFVRALWRDDLGENALSS
jgi:hypothetical protein